MMRALGGALLALAGSVALFATPAHASDTHDNGTGDPVCVDVSSVPQNTYIRIGMGNQLTGTIATQLSVDGQLVAANVSATWISSTRIEFDFDLGSGNGWDLGADMTPVDANTSTFNVADSFVGRGIYATSSGNFTFSGSGDSVITLVSPARDGPTILEWQLNGQICTPPPPPPPSCDCTCEDGRPVRLTLRYTGDGPDGSNHSQDDDKVTVTGDPNDAPQVRIVITDRRKKFSENGEVYFDGVVSLGGFFVADADTAGFDKIGPETIVRIYDLSGNLLQYVQFHTSCSQPLNVGDQFGSIELMAYEAVQTGGGKGSKGSKSKSSSKSKKSSKAKKK